MERKYEEVEVMARKWFFKDFYLVLRIFEENVRAATVTKYYK